MTLTSPIRSVRLFAASAVALAASAVESRAVTAGDAASHLSTTHRAAIARRPQRREEMSADTASLLIAAMLLLGAGLAARRWSRQPREVLA